MTSPAPPQPDKLPAEKQQRLHVLLDKNGEGTITPEERSELEALVEASEKLMIANARRLVEFTKEIAHAPLGAVPVTVWVKSEHTEL